jgi:diguanylate cyclase (GGDEF)-like protein
MAGRSVTTRKSGKVLVINSDPEIINILEINLAHANLEIVSARSGSEALRKIQKDKTDIIILDPALPDMEGMEIYRKITGSYLTNHIPIILLSARLPRKTMITRADDIPIYHITKPFNPKEVVALVQGYLMHKERMERINPLTGLPNRLQISKEIDRLLRQKKTFSAVYIVFHDLKAVNKAYGYTLGDHMVQFLADIVSETVRLSGNTEDLVGYYGGDKFVVISTPWKTRALCRKIITDFDKRIPVLCSEENVQMSRPGSRKPPTNREQAPIMSIHIAVVTNQKRNYRSFPEVTEVAMEQIEYLKRSPESNCYFDLKASGIEPFLTPATRESVPTHKEGLKTIQGLLTWFDFLISEVNTPMNVIKDCLHSLKSTDIKNLSQEQLDHLDTLHNHHNRLSRVIEGITNLTRSHDGGNDAHFDEVDVVSVLEWVLEQVNHLAEQKGIKVDIEAAGDIGRIIRDKKSLTQSLLYTVRSAIFSSPPGSKLHIRVAEKIEENICIEINNPEHRLSARELNNLFKPQSGLQHQQETFINELHPARILVRGIGGELEAISEKDRGVTFHLKIPKKWRSWIQEVDTLQLAMEISRKEARDIVSNIHQIISSLDEQLPSVIKDNIDMLSSKVQEMGVLCNRSLFLADDLSNRLESQQDWLLQQEMEQLTTLEAMLIPCREITKTTHANNLFELESARRVTKYALSIAGEFKFTERGRRLLRYAALLKDLGLALSPGDMMEQMITATPEEAAAIKTRSDLMWKALATINFLKPVLDIVAHRYERYDGKGRRFGAKENDIPLAARILAVADAFDFMTSGRSPQGKLSQKMAMDKIVEDSGLRYDPHVVSAFLMSWKRRGLEPAISRK